MLWTKYEAPKGKTPASKMPRCPESGKMWVRLAERDQCPHCGRVVREKAGRVPEHKYPTRLGR